METSLSVVVETKNMAISHSLGCKAILSQQFSISQAQNKTSVTGPFKAAFLLYGTATTILSAAPAQRTVYTMPSVQDTMHL